MSRPDFISPIMMSAPLVASIGSQTLAAYPFLNPNKTAMLVDQFRLTTNGSNPFIPTMSTIDIMFGGIPLTNGLVPIAAMFPRFLGANNGVTFTGAYSASSYYPGTPGPTQGTADYAFTCHLERPLYVPYGTTFQIRIAAGSDIGAGWYFSIHGRSLPGNFKKPRSISVPWLSGFCVDPNTDLAYTCSDAALVNPFPTPLFIRHLQGETESDTRFQTLIQITTSSNRALVRDPMPFDFIFPDDRRILPLSAKLDQHEFLRVGLSLDRTPPPGGYLGRTAVGMVGFRELPTPFAPGE